MALALRLDQNGHQASDYIFKIVTLTPINLDFKFLNEPVDKLFSIIQSVELWKSHHKLHWCFLWTVHGVAENDF